MKMSLRFTMPCILGVYPHEKTRSIPLQCCIEWIVRESKEGGVPIDYDQIYGICSDILSKKPFDWIEEVPIVMQCALIETFGDHRWNIHIEKPLPYGTATCSLESS